MTTIYWAGGEDCDCYQLGGGAVTTSSFYYRSTYARCALQVTNANDSAWENWLPFTFSTGWFSARYNTSQVFNRGGNSAILLNFRDASNIERIRINCTSSNNTLQVYKVNAAGSATQLGSNFTMIASSISGSPDKLDIYLDYQASGTLTIYWNAIQVFTYSGDVTTDGNTSLSYFRCGGQNGGSNPSGAWSEIILADTDTRSWNLQTLAPVANGNTHNFDTGSPAAANVNETTLNDATLDGSTSAGQIDQYTIPSIAAGTYTITAVGVSARCQKGASGPTKMDLGVRSGGSDYWSSDQALTTTWAGYQNWWVTDPNTAATWAALPSNIGLKSVA